MKGRHVKKRLHFLAILTIAAVLVCAVYYVLVYGGFDFGFGSRSGPAGLSDSEKMKILESLASGSGNKNGTSTDQTTQTIAERQAILERLSARPTTATTTSQQKPLSDEEKLKILQSLSRQ